ncbi:MAG: polysaccharide deacetylase family protein, partial [Betaproteobacteria bacterium]|nr:polysaccharide deacetylase family protein [Betaproteobacteria bacterium]
MNEDPQLYPYLPSISRPKISWPGGARLAVWVAPNIEHYEYDPPPSPVRSPTPRPAPDINWLTLRDYGNRAGVWRMMEVMDRYGVRGSVSLNVGVCDHYPEIIEACVKRGWELFSHGVYNTRYLYGMDTDQERELIEDVKATIYRASGQPLSGWLSPALSNTVDTMDLLADAGVLYTCDLMHDDQPLPVKVKSDHRLISMPYSLEVNDYTCLVLKRMTPRRYTETIKAQFDQLWEEGADNPQVMCLPLHPWLIGLPHRLREFDEALRYITRRDKVWLATGR